jgi:hypothetical protein
MTINLSQRCGLGVELTFLYSDLSNSFYRQFGYTNATPNTYSPLLQPPVHIIFDNQTDTAIAISYDGVNTWRTFPAGEAVLLDMRANHGLASNFTFSNGTQFYAKLSGVSAGTSGNFSISYTYAVPQ